jgi:solute carrier family 25, member 44
MDLEDSATQCRNLDQPVAGYRNLEWAHLNKRKFVLYNVGVFFVIRFLLYPANVVKTRYQMQLRNNLYKSTGQAFLHILRTGGVSALYAGFPTASLFLIVQQAYLFLYEYMRARDRGWPAYFDEPVRNGLSAAVSVCCVQLLGNPIDVVSQRLMLRERPSGAQVAPVSAPAAAAAAAVPPLVALSPVPPRHRARDIAMEVYRSKGVRGFYSGFGVSCAQFVPAASLWWSAYPMLRGAYLSFFDRASLAWRAGPDSTCPGALPAVGSWTARVSEVLAGASSSLIVAVAVAPLDVIRTRAQIEGMSGLVVTRQLLETEGVRGLWKGVTARAAMLVPQGAVSVWAYEQVKRWSAEF